MIITFDDKPLIDSNFNETQNVSNVCKGRNFMCPVCRLHRIAKALVGEKDEWFHTGCKCTYKWLVVHEKLNEPIKTFFSGTKRFVG